MNPTHRKTAPFPVVDPNNPDHGKADAPDANATSAEANADANVNADAPVADKAPEAGKADMAADANAPAAAITAPATVVVEPVIIAANANADASVAPRPALALVQPVVPPVAEPVKEPVVEQFFAKGEALERQAAATRPPVEDPAPPARSHAKPQAERKLPPPSDSLVEPRPARRLPEPPNWLLGGLVGAMIALLAMLVVIWLTKPSTTSPAPTPTVVTTPPAPTPHPPIVVTAPHKPSPATPKTVSECLGLVEPETSECCNRLTDADIDKGIACNLAVSRRRNP